MHVSRRKKMLVALVCLTLASVLVFAGCQRQEPTQGTTTTTAATQPTEADVSGTISITGSTSVQPLVQDLAHIFTDKYPNITVDVQAGGSSNGIRAPYEGTSDIGMSSRDLKPEEKEWGLTEHIMALDGIAVIVNKSNGVSGLTKDQVLQIYTGEITNWNEVGGADQEILVVSREAGSGTRGAFEDIVGFKDLVADALIGNGTGAIKAHVADKENAIGYISLGALDENTKSLRIDGVAPTAANIKAGSYPVSRPFLLLTKGEMSGTVALFMEFVMSDEGQQLIADAGFIDMRPSAEEPIAGSITVVGSTSVQPLVQDLAHIFGDLFPDVVLDVQGGGSSNGVKAPYDGTADIGMSSRDLKTEEKEWGLTEHVIALDGIAVIVNKGNTISNLSKDQIRRIYVGEITNWNEVGGADQQILVVSREAGSGTRGAFEDIVGFKDLVADALIGNGTGAIKAHVVDKVNAIGYISLGALDDSIKSIEVDGALPTIDNIKAGRYPVSRPFILLTKGEMSAAAAKFMEFIFSDAGQQIVKDSGFIDMR